MNFTGAVGGRDDIDVLALEYSDGWLYEVKIKDHPIYDTSPYRSSQRYPSREDALDAGKLKSRDLLC